QTPGRTAPRRRHRGHRERRGHRGRRGAGRAGRRAEPRRPGVLRPGRGPGQPPRSPPPHPRMDHPSRGPTDPHTGTGNPRLHTPAHRDRRPPDRGRTGRLTPGRNRARLRTDAEKPMSTLITIIGVFWLIVGLLGPGGWPALAAGALLLWAGLLLSPTCEQMRRNPMNTLLTPDQDTVHADTVHAIIH